MSKEPKKDRFFMREVFYSHDSRDPYMTRLSAGDFSIHIMHRGDNDPSPHDHARPFRTFPLTSYVEAVYDPSTNYYRREVVLAGRFYDRPAAYCHRIVGKWAGMSRTVPQTGLAGELNSWTATQPGPIITLVWWGRSCRRWGFWPLKSDGTRSWVWWRTYLFEEPDLPQRYAPVLTHKSTLLWRLAVVWIMQTQFRGDRLWSLLRPAQFIHGLRSDWQYSAGMLELATEAYDFCEPGSYDPVSPLDAIQMDMQYWED